MSEEDLRGSLTKTTSQAALSLDDKIQRKLDRETGGRRKGGRRRDNALTFSMPPQQSADPDREAVKKALMEKRKNKPVMKHLSASMKMSMTADDLANLEEDLEEEKEEVKGWTCETCTFVNENMDHLACSVCGAARDNK